MNCADVAASVEIANLTAFDSRALSTEPGGPGAVRSFVSIIACADFGAAIKTDILAPAAPMTKRPVLAWTIRSSA